MYSKLFKILILFLGGILIFPLNLKAETNLEYFFGTKPTSKYDDVVIKKVLTTDTFILKEGEKIKLIGLKGIEAPREKQKKTKVNNRGQLVREEKKISHSIENRALEFARDLLENKHVRLEFDTRQKDDYNRTLAYAFFIDDNVFINAEILRNGFAYLQIRIPNKKYVQELKAAYKESREEKRGLQGQ